MVIPIKTNHDDNNLYEMDVQIMNGQANIINAPPKSDISRGIIIDRRKIALGIYFVQLFNGDKMKVIKVLKTRN